MYLWVGAGLVGLAVLVSCRVQIIQARRLARLDDRLAHLTAAISLLTDTTEGGLRDVAREVERQAAAPTPAARPKTRAATQRRVASAARRGRSVREIAASEAMSEGEVRLRLQLDGARGGKVNHASVR
jgi:hypothetical protein